MRTEKSIMHARFAFLSVAVVTIVVGGGMTACEPDTSGHEAKQPHGTVAASKKAGTPKSKDAAGQAEDSDTITVALGSTAKWSNGVTATLSKFSRGTSGEYAFPDHKSYLAFTVTMHNGAKKNLDLSMVSLSCPKGADQVSDSDQGLNGSPDSHLLAGQNASWKTACVFPASASKAQIEVTPYTEDAEWYRTAIFTGDVK